MKPPSMLLDRAPGDGEAICAQNQVADLLLKHKRSIRRFIARRSGPHVLRRTAIDDLFQQTATAAIEAAEAFVYRDDAGFLSWVQTIARRVIWGTLDASRRRPSTTRIKGAWSSGAGVAESELSGVGSTPSSVVAGSENLADLRRAMGQLPEHYRRVLVLYKIEQLPLTEVAEAMGRTKGATCRLIARAIEQLRQILIQA